MSIQGKKKIPFTKMSGAGNDFVLIDRESYAGSLRELAKKICHRKFGVGSDGLLVIKKNKTDAGMRIFNADGSEASMCGNGARCAAQYVVSCRKTGSGKFQLKTKAGSIACDVNGSSARIKLTQPTGIKLDFPIDVNGRPLRVNFINTGVPHVVIFAEGLGDLDVAGLGSMIRHHKHFFPQGANVNFVEVLAKDSLWVRTYERGVEDETLACGTGSTAAALVYGLKDVCVQRKREVSIKTKSGETLKVLFFQDGLRISDVRLQGKVQKICEGVYYV